MSERIEKGMGGAVPGVPGLRRVLAPNPSAMTGPGTWTHIVGEKSVAIIDPGPDDPAHLAAILAALPARAEVAAILVTHAHLDHSALAPTLAQATGAPVLAFGTATDGRSPTMIRLVASGLTSGGEGLDHAFRPDRRLAHGELVSAGDWTLTALHTPGHLGGHLCFALGDVLFSGDHVMAWAPSLVSPPDGDMGAYMSSLELLSRTPWRLMVPAHGNIITDPAARLAELISHRRAREAQVLAALEGGSLRLDQVTQRVYHDLAPTLLPAASRNALAHLIDLWERNLVQADPHPNPSAQWSRR